MQQGLNRILTGPAVPAAQQQTQLRRSPAACQAAAAADTREQARPMSGGQANGKAAAGMEAIFPEALASLQAADPEVYGIIQDEKKRQWCAPGARPAPGAVSCARIATGAPPAPAGGHRGRPLAPAWSPRWQQQVPNRFSTPAAPAAGQQAGHGLTHSLRTGWASSSSPRRTSPRRP